jgi:hypothetical protein
LDVGQKCGKIEDVLYVRPLTIQRKRYCSRFFYDLQLAVDIGDVVVLTLLDKSAAFDNIDQVILPNRLVCCFDMSGSVCS